MMETVHNMRNIIIILLFFIAACKSDKYIHIINRQYHLPTIEVIINGVPVEMILDTGGAITILDDDIVDKLNIKKLSWGKEITGYGGIKKILLVDQSTINIGKYKMEGDIYVTDIEYIVNSLPIGGILGIDHISSVGMNIDFEGNIITIQ